MARRKTTLAVLAFGLTSAVNPAFLLGCARLGFSYDFGEPEMVALVDVASRGGPYRAQSNGREVVVSFALTQTRGTDVLSSAEPLVRSAHACGNRTFLRSADACLDVTKILVEGTLTVSAADDGAVVVGVPVTGELMASGTQLRHADLVLTGGENIVDLSSRDAKTFAVRSVTLASR